MWEDVLPKLGESPSDFILRLQRAQTATAPNQIAESTYWANLNGIVVGRIALRHALNENLKVFGGHIGYEVRPSYRQKGIGNEMLKAVLQTPKAKSLGRLLLTCAPDNIASNKTIMTNGGVLFKTAFVEKWQRNTNYYWIDLTPKKN